MKKIILFSLLVAFFATSAFTADFSPLVLEISAPKAVQYDFDGSELNIPVTVAGTNANSVFLVYTKDKANSIGEVVNGYLGWHYVNKVDTAVYISTPTPLAKGSNTISWDGKDDDGNAVDSGDYTYYIWGYDDVTARYSMCDFIFNFAGSGGVQALIQEVGTDGLPLVNPVFYSAQSPVELKEKWIIGGDPSDATLLETTNVTLPENWIQDNVIDLVPTDHSKFFMSGGLNLDSGRLKGVWKLNWVPNGEAEIDVEWGDNGFSGITEGHDKYSGPVADFNYVYYIDNQYHGYNNDAAQANFIYFDLEDGSLVREIDLTEWWSNADDLAAGSQMNGGPNGMMQRGDYIFLNSHSSCTKQMVNPSAEADEDFFMWTNGNGDYTLDHNFEEDSSRAWVCNDYRVGPYTTALDADANLFSVSTAFDMGAVSFGLLAPDGTGLSYFAYAGETANWKSWNMHCDNGGAYDGHYVDNHSVNPDYGKFDDYPAGIFFVAQDSFMGVISREVSVDEAPTAFAVDQNSPNPFNPSTTISFTIADAGNVSIDVFNVAGQKVNTIVNEFLGAGSHSVTWDASGFSAGVYFYTVKTGDYSKTLKMTLLK